MPKIFPHRPRKVRLAQPRPVVAHEDPEAYRRRVTTERSEREQIAAARRARQAERRQARLRHKSDLDELERLAVAAFPWRKLDLQLGAIAAAGGYPLERPHIGIGSWWAAHNIFGFTAAQQFSVDWPPRASTVLRGTCPFSINLSSIDPMVELLTRAWAINSGLNFNVDAFRTGARTAARDKTEHRRASLQAVRDAGVILHDLGGGWFAVNPQFDRDVTIFVRGKAPSASRRRDPRGAAFEMDLGNDLRRVASLKVWRA